MSDVASFTITKLSGKTIRFIVDDLTDIDGNAVTDVVGLTINLYDQNETLVTTGSVQQADAPDDDTYYADITLPTVTRPTKYLVRASGAKNTAVYKDLGIIWVVLQ